ncbi:MAG: Ig-like domain-containing protein, partial [Chthoniobacteraceae bacterium]
MLLSSQDLLHPEAAPFADAILITAPLAPAAPKLITASSLVSDTLFTDSEGELFQVKLSGPGSVTVTLDDPDGDGKGEIASLELNGTTEKSALSVKMKSKAASGKDGEVSIDALTGTGSLGSLDAAKSDLTGAGISISGTIAKLTLDDVKNGADITLPGRPLSAKTQLALVFGDIGAGSNLSAAAGVKAVTVHSAGVGLWNAPSFAKVTATGGSLAASLTATASAQSLGKTLAIGSVTVTDGDFTGDLNASGGIGAILVKKKATGGNASGHWTAATFASIATTGGNLDAMVEATASAASLGKKLAIGKVSVAGGDFTGDFSAVGDIGSFDVKADKIGGGNVTGATLTGANLGKVTIGNTISGSFILAGATLGTDRAPGGLDFAADFFQAGNIAGFTAGTVSNSVIGAGLTSSDGIIGNDEDDLAAFAGGKLTTIKSFTVKTATAGSVLFAAGTFPAKVKIGAGSVTPGSDARFLTTASPDHKKPKISGALMNDTGVSATDSITSDPTIAGTATDNIGVTQLEAAFGSDPFVSVTTSLVAGAFSLDRAKLEMVKGSTLADGTYTLHLRASDAAGNQRTTDVTFTLDTTAPLAPSFDLSPASDTGAPGDKLTSAAVVTLTGTAEGNARVNFGSVVSQAGPTGAFLLPNVTLAEGDNLFMLTASDAAGNSAQTMATFTRNVALGSTDVVLEWNAVNLEAIRLDATPPPTATRGLAMVSGAILDVINAFEHTPGFFVNRTPAGGESLEAAVAAAAHKVLSYLFPGQQAFLDASLATTLARVPDGTSETAGVAFGASLGQAIIDLRAGDGFDQYVDYTGSTDPGKWQPTAPMFDVDPNQNWVHLDPFVLTSRDQFRPDGPTPLDSTAWVDDYNLTKDLGRNTGSSRTADQTQIARFWADGAGTYSPPGHWNKLAEEIAADRGLSISANARLFAELNVAMADAGVAAWDAKYAYSFWRPITAIQNGDLDGNPFTDADETWEPLLITPAFPEYVSGHSTFSGAAATVLDATFGANTSFSTTSLGLPGVTRTFVNFQAAAEEAGISRIYGGIHFLTSDLDGLATGRSVGALVHERFEVATDTAAPLLVVDAPPLGLVTNSGTINVQGRALDNISGIATLTAKLDDNGGTNNVSITDTQGHFSVPISLAVDGSKDGLHTLHLIATDNAGNVTPVDFPFTLDTVAPSLAVDTPAANAVLVSGDLLSGTVGGTGSLITALRYKFETGPTASIAFDAETGAFQQELDLSRLGAGAHTLTVIARDAAGLETTVSRSVSLAAAIPLTITHFTPTEGMENVGTTFRPQIFFSRPVNTSTLTANNFYATDTAGNKLPATIVPANDGSFAWLFFTNPMPGAANITMHVDGETILAASGGQKLDGDGDGVAGGAFEYMFSTVSLVAVEGTSLSGIVLDPGADLKPMTFDDIRAGADGVLHTADDVFLNRLEHVKVFIVGLEDQAVFTDSMGRFSFPSVPVGNVKLAIDGRTATNAPAGFYFPEMVMDQNIRAGVANTVMGSAASLSPEENVANLTRPEVYLPRLRTSILQPVNNNGMTMVGVDAQSAPNLTPEQRAGLTLEIQPGSLIGADGKPLANGVVGISTVPPELVREMLPPGVLQHTFDITIQAPDTATFAQPAPITFPNVFNAAPGTKLNFLSFDHTTGRLVIEGTATVSEDGLTVATDPGYGITKPGWHGLTPPGTNNDPPCPPTKAHDIDIDPIPISTGLDNQFFKNDDGTFTMQFRNGAAKRDPSGDPCNPENIRVTPLIVKITVEGNTGLGHFADGLTTMQFSLQPQQQKDIKVDLEKLLTAAKIDAALENILF